MFETRTSIPPEAGGIFLSAQEKDDARGLVEKYEKNKSKSDKHKAELARMLPNPAIEDKSGKQTYQSWVDSYVRQKGTYWRERQMAAVAILLPGNENLTRLRRVKKVLYGDLREIGHKEHTETKAWIRSINISDVLAGAGVAIEYEPPNPFLEMRITYTENLKEQAAMSEDVARTIRRRGGELRERIVEGCLDNFATGVEIVSESREDRYFVGPKRYIIEYDWEDDRVIHYYDGQLDSYDGHRNSNVTDDVRMLSSVANATQILFTSDKIIE